MAWMSWSNTLHVSALTERIGSCSTGFAGYRLASWRRRRKTSAFILTSYVSSFGTDDSGLSRAFPPVRTTRGICGCKRTRLRWLTTGCRCRRTSSSITLLSALARFPGGATWYKLGRMVVGQLDAPGSWNEALRVLVERGLVVDRCIEGEPLPRLELTKQGEAHVMSMKLEHGSR